VPRKARGPRSVSWRTTSAGSLPGRCTPSTTGALDDAGVTLVGGLLGGEHGPGIGASYARLARSRPVRHSAVTPVTAVTAAAVRAGGADRPRAAEPADGG
jgi:hypothetical protein